MALTNIRNANRSYSGITQGQQFKKLNQSKRAGWPNNELQPARRRMIPLLMPSGSDVRRLGVRMGVGIEVTNAGRHKTEEIYRQMDLMPYQLSFDKPVDEWIDCAKKFLADRDLIKDSLPQRLELRAQEAMNTLDVIASFV